MKVKEEIKEKLPASTRRWCSSGRSSEARNVPTGPAQEEDNDKSNMCISADTPVASLMVFVSLFIYPEHQPVRSRHSVRSLLLHDHYWVKAK